MYLTVTTVNFIQVEAEISVFNRSATSSRTSVENGYARHKPFLIAISNLRPSKAGWSVGSESGPMKSGIRSIRLDGRRDMVPSTLAAKQSRQRALADR